MPSQENRSRKVTVAKRWQVIRAIVSNSWNVGKLHQLERLRAAAYSSSAIAVILKTDTNTVRRILFQSGLTKLYPIYVQGTGFKPVPLAASWPGGLFRDAYAEIAVDLLEKARDFTPEKTTISFNQVSKEMTLQERREERTKLEIALCAQKEFKFIKIKSPLSSTGGEVVIDDVIYYLKSDGDTVKQTANGWLLNSRPVTEQDLLTIANRRRRAAKKQPFELKE